MTNRIEAKIHRLAQLIDRVTPDEDYSKPRELLAELEEELGARHPELCRHRKLIEFMEMPITD